MFDQQSQPNDRSKFLGQLLAAREERDRERRLNTAATSIQAFIRAFLARRSFNNQVQSEFDQLFGSNSDSAVKKTSIDCFRLFDIAQRLVFIVRRELLSRRLVKVGHDGYVDNSCRIPSGSAFSLFDSTQNDGKNATVTIWQQLESLCKHIVMSLFSEDPNTSYIGIIVLKPEMTAIWTRQITHITTIACTFLRHLKPELANHHGSVATFLNVLVCFTSTSSWKVLKTAEYERYRHSLEQICHKVTNQLVHSGLYHCMNDLLLRGLTRTKPSLKKTSITAIITVSTRPMQCSSYADQHVQSFVLHIFSVPALIWHLNHISPEAVQIFYREPILKRIIELLAADDHSRVVFATLEGNYTLCLMANLVHLAFTSLKFIRPHVIDFVCVLKKMLDSCQKYVLSKQSSISHWHPVLGWFSQNVDQKLHESMSHVKQQLQYLWNPQMIELIFAPLFEMTSAAAIEAGAAASSRKSSTIPVTTGSAVVQAALGSSETGTSGDNQTAATSVQGQSFTSWRQTFIGKAFERAASLGGRSGSTSGLSGHCWNPIYKLGTPETSLIALVCSLYENAFTTLSQMKHDILSGLCFKELILPHLWRFITLIGPHNPARAYLDYLSMHSKSCAPEFQILIIFCECATHLITILDDIELYENQKPFSLEDLVMISQFLNNFVFKLIWHNLIDIQNMSTNALLNSTHSLLMLLYKRDSRRPFTPPYHWLIRELKMSSFMKDLEHGKRTAQAILQKVPHIIHHKERIGLFRKYITLDRHMLTTNESCIINSTLVTVHRARIVEDGYQQLNSLPSQSLKGVIRVKFINEQGLDEAGIDQDGVFKEFLEDTIKRIFDPSLNLFRVTSEQRLYPSPTSYIHENHLSLFEFVGKMIGKAVYEGIVVDVPFASFFLSQVLGQQQSALYSSIDELPSLDPELYKHLTFLKHYDEGDISSLDLTFSVDEDAMGQIVTHELLHGGKAIPVTKETRISYIHLMAHFRMHTQIHEQTAAFIRGFRSIINPEWLTMFSTPEFQRLISGDNSPIDLEDLRRHTKYFGGFHANHRVICWLWDILQSDFSVEEHRLFLKFVTSCSKPPLLGFAHLEPPFSIRCVEVSDDQDTGDTVGSVLRGFFTIRRKDPVNRLPTSSTCFNLLKLPNYQRKSTLKEKLRYAINSNPGFELS